MNVRLESMCQGDGKIYAQIAIERLSADSIVTLEAHLKDGTEIPAHLLPFDPLDGQSAANFVIIVPHFDEREIMLEFNEYRGADAPLGRAHLTIETNMLTWRTRINSVVKNELIAQMFDIEREYYSDRMHTSFIAAVDDKDEIVVKMLIDLPQIEGADVAIRFLDAHGKERELPVYPLFEEIKPARRFGDENRINVGFSVRVPRDDKDFCVFASDALDVVPGGFAMFCDESYEPLRTRFFERTVDAAHDPAYDAWYLLHSATLADLAEQRRTTFTYEPLISLVIPLVQGEAELLARCLTALAAQTYNVFEAIVVDRYYGDAEFAALGLEQGGACALTRVKVDEVLGADEMFAAGLAEAKGSYCALLEPDIMLAPEALFEVVRRINERRVLEDEAPARVLYAHHDVLDANGMLCELACKPLYSPDLLLSYNYAGPLIFFERELLDQLYESAGFVREALVYDLLLKAIETTGSIERIDQILYHVARAPREAAGENQARIEAHEEDFRGGRRAVANHLKRRGIEATVLSDIHEELYRLNYALPAELPSVLVIVVNREQPYLLESCIESLFEKSPYDNLQVCIVDNASTSLETFSTYGRIQGKHEEVDLIRITERSGYAACIAQALEAHESNYVLLLDGAVEFETEGALERWIGMCTRSEVGVVGAKLLLSDDTVSEAGITVGSARGATTIGTDLPRTAPGYLKRLACTNDVSAVSSACQFIRRSLLDEVGGYDDRFKLDFGDTDFCLRVIKAGYFVVFDPEVELYHFKNKIKDDHLSDARRIRLEQERAYLHFKWPRAFVEGDPFSSSLLAPGDGYYQLYR